MKNIYYYIKDINNYQNYNWGIFSVLSYYIKNNKNSEYSINEINEINELDNFENKENTFILISIPFFHQINILDIIINKLKFLVDNIENKKYKIILGGAAVPQIVPETIHEYFPEIDYIVFGHGEEITKKIINGEINIPGVYNGNEYPYKLDSFHEFFTNKLTKIPIIIDGLKCPWNKCKFCIHSTDDKINLSVNDTITIIKDYYNMGKKDFYICDNWLNMNKFYKILDILLAEGMDDIQFELFGVHITSNYKKLIEYIPKFKNNLITTSTWGVEYLDDEVLDLYQKGITVEKIFEHGKFMKESGIELEVYMLMGLPGLKQHNIDLMYENLLKYDKYVSSYRYSTFTLDSNIDVFKNPNKYGLKIGKQSTLNYQFQISKPLLSTIYSYEIYNYEESKFISSEDNIKRYKHIIDKMEETNLK